MESVLKLWAGSGLANIAPGQVVMILVCLVLLYLAIRKGFEPLLLVPIGFGGLLSNIPEAGMALSAVENALHAARPEVLAALAPVLGVPYEVGQVVTPEVQEAFKQALNTVGAGAHVTANQIAVDAGYATGILRHFFDVAIMSGAAPLLIFLGVGAMTDFGPLLANPKTLLLGAAAQFGIFGTVLGAVLLSMTGIVDFSIREAAAIGIIGGADGPTSIYTASILAPHLLGAIAVAAYSYMALVPLIQPPIMKALRS